MIEALDVFNKSLTYLLLEKFEKLTLSQFESLKCHIKSTHS